MQAASATMALVAAPLRGLVAQGGVGALAGLTARQFCRRFSAVPQPDESSEAAPAPTAGGQARWLRELGVIRTDWTCVGSPRMACRARAEPCADTCPACPCRRRPVGAPVGARSLLFQQPPLPTVVPQPRGGGGGVQHAHDGAGLPGCQRAPHVQRPLHGAQTDCRRAQGARQKCTRLMHSHR